MHGGDHDVVAWFAIFFAIVIGGASILTAIWAIALIAFPAESRHFEIAIPAFGLAIVGASIAIFLWRRWGS